LSPHADDEPEKVKNSPLMDPEIIKHILGKLTMSNDEFEKIPTAD
jgi:hypothetical protein